MSDENNSRREKSSATKEEQFMESLLAKSCVWNFIQDITQLDQAGFETLKKSEAHFAKL